MPIPEEHIFGWDEAPPDEKLRALYDWCILLTGEVGTGKTTLINRLLDWLHLKRTKTAFLFNSRMNSSQLFDFILAEFDISCDSRSKSQQLMKLNHWLLDRYRAGDIAQPVTRHRREPMRVPTGAQDLSAPRRPGRVLEQGVGDAKVLGPERVLAAQGLRLPVQTHAGPPAAVAPQRAPARETQPELHVVHEVERFVETSGRAQRFGPHEGRRLFRQTGSFG